MSLSCGAASSIGSELARQVFALGPRRLILVDRAESPLYLLQRELELRSDHGQTGIEIRTALANITNRPAMDKLISLEAPWVIFHAAAYKHVPMMEAHPSDAMFVNVSGTQAVLDAAPPWSRLDASYTRRVDQTVTTLLIAMGGAAVGVVVIAGAYAAAHAAARDARAAPRNPKARLGATSPAPWADPPTGPVAPPAIVPKMVSPGVVAPKRAVGVVSPQAGAGTMVERIHRTRSLLLRWLDVLEAEAVGDDDRAGSLRAGLGELADADFGLLGGTGLAESYLATVSDLRAQHGAGLTTAFRSRTAGLRVNVLSSLAQQERRIARGEPLLSAPIPRWPRSDLVDDGPSDTRPGP